MDDRGSIEKRKFLSSLFLRVKIPPAVDTKTTSDLYSN